jgi:hypothetical protein
MRMTTVAMTAALGMVMAGLANAAGQEGTRWLTWQPFMQTTDCELKLVDVFHRAPDQPIYFRIKNMSKNRVSYHFGMTILRGGHTVGNAEVAAENVNPGETRDSQSLPIKGSLKGSTIAPRVEDCKVVRPR